MSTDRKHIDGRIGIEGVGHAALGYEREKGSHPTLGDVNDIVRLHGGKRFKKAVAVCVDEAQNIRPESKASDLANTLHTQSTLPILLVCAGLSNTRDRLLDIGISRPASRHVIPLKALSRAETLSAARQALEVIVNTGVRAGDAALNSLAERIAVAADRWPRHLTCYLQGACEALLEQPTPRLDDLDQEKVIEKGSVLRDAYYKDRCSTSNLPAEIINGLYERLSDSRPLTKAGCASLLKAAVDSFEGEEKVFLQERFVSSDELLAQSLKAGIVTINEDECCEIPIPSMAGYVRARVAQAETPGHLESDAH